MKKVLFLDLDGCLKSEVGAVANHGLIREVNYNWRDEPTKYSFIQRPYLIEFLDAVSHNYDIRLATMGWRKYAEQALDVMGITKYFSYLVCGVELRRPTKVSSFTIVDDRMELLEWKAEQISHGDTWAQINKILIPSFIGGYDDELIKMAEKLNQL
jgi:hypothetical protein